MVFKNLERTTFKWFSLREVKELDQVEDKLKFINSFSFGPFVPYNLYHFFHNLWDFYVMELASSYVYLFVFYFVYLGFLINFFKGMFSSINSIDSINSIPDPSSFFGALFPMMLIGVILSLIIYLGVKLFQCFTCRRLSWNRCEWKDYDAFEQGERNWNVVGMVFFILQTLGMIVAIAIIIFAWQGLMPMIKEALNAMA
jgi:hypothetical protein